MIEVSIKTAIIEAYETLLEKATNLEAQYNRYLYVSRDAPEIKEEIAFLNACLEKLCMFCETLDIQ